MSHISPVWSRWSCHSRDISHRLVNAAAHIQWARAAAVSIPACKDGGATNAAGGGDPGGTESFTGQFHQPGESRGVLRDQLCPGTCSTNTAGVHRDRANVSGEWAVEWEWWHDSSSSVRSTMEAESDELNSSSPPDTKPPTSVLWQSYFYKW